MTKDPKTLTDKSRRDALRVMAAGTAMGFFAPNLLGQPAQGQTRPAPKGRIDYAHRALVGSARVQ